MDLPDLSARYASHTLNDPPPHSYGPDEYEDYPSPMNGPPDHRRYASEGNWVYGSPPEHPDMYRRRPSQARTAPILPRPQVEGPYRPGHASRHPSFGESSRRRIESSPLNSLDWRSMKRERNPRPKPKVNALENFRRTRAWPPEGYSVSSRLDPQEAEDVICAGASTFKGYVQPIPNAPGSNRFFATMQFESSCRTDRAVSYDADAFKDISLTQVGRADEAYPWVSLEHPSMAYAFGKYPGTMTLAYFVGKASDTPKIRFSTQERPRKVTFMDVLNRLKRLEEQGIEEDESELYVHLYSMLLHDPEQHVDPHVGLDQQINDLVTILTHKDWIDFSKPKNQIVAKYYDSKDVEIKQDFFHQLLLACELYLRIYSSAHTAEAIHAMLKELPPKVSWDLALSQRWLENMKINRRRASSNHSTFEFLMNSRIRQKDAISVFAAKLKWPNMDEVEYILEERDPNEKPIEDRSADASSWFSGAVLPGTTLPWLLMNTLIDCDKDTGPELRYLSHLHPSSGFQYRANTYWSYECIVGKVLGAARGVNQATGWIGPCVFSPDLKRKESVLIRQLPPLEPRLTTKEISAMADVSAPLGPASATYPIEEYEVIIPDMDNVTDSIRVEKLSFRPVRDKEEMERYFKYGTPMTFDAEIIFAIKGESWPLELRYDVDFVSAMPCHEGPHVLFWDFAYRALKVDEGLISLNDWGLQSRSSGISTAMVRHVPNSTNSSTIFTPSSSSSGFHSNSLALMTTNPFQPEDPTYHGVEKVLAIEALGVSDNEVFARAWCAHWGFHAIIANIRETCMACAIREAYAAQISVVILTEGGKRDEKDD